MTEQSYLDLCSNILLDGIESGDRTGVGVRSLFGQQVKFDLSLGFPLITTKKMFRRGMIEELLWFISGSTNARALEDKNVNIWKQWGDSERELGPIYGHQLRNLNARLRLRTSKFGYKYEKNGYDQLGRVIDSIKLNPESRRHIISLWNSSDLKYQALPCCHGTVIQFYVSGGKLSCHMYQRSADAFLGLPFNIASYSLLTSMIAQVCELDVGQLIISLGDSHIYLNHLRQVKTQLNREPFPFPKLKLNRNIKNIDDFTIDNIKIIGYESHPAIKGEVAV